MPKFWLVWTPTGLNPSYRHSTQAAAEMEAKRLSIKEPGKEFFVMEMCGVARSTVEVKWEGFEHASGL